MSRDDRSLLNRPPSPPRPSVPMKRTISSESPNSPVPGPLGSNAPPNTPPTRRHKTSKACTACRQQKSRCDPGDGSADTGFACRRCRHFNLPCSLSSSSTPNTQGPGPSTNIRTPVLIDITPARRSQRPPPPVPVPSAPSKPYTPPPASATPKFEHPAPSYDTPPSPRFTVESIRPPLAKVVPLDKHAKAEVGGMWEKALTFVNDLVTPGDPDARSVPDDVVPHSVVSSDEARELTRIWNRNYSVWVTQENPLPFNGEAGNSSPKATQFKSSFLQAVQFYLVAQNLPSSSSVSAATRSRLSAEVQHGLFNVMLGGDVSMSSIRALQILSLWSDALVPSRVGPGARGAYDGEMLMASAMRIVSNLRLELDIQKALKAVDNRGRNLSAPTDEILQESLNRARLLYSLTISDAVLAIGKGRIPSTRVPLREAERIFGSPSKLVTRPGGGPDARLVIQCNLFDIAIRALTACASHGEVEAIGVEAWISRVNSYLTQFDTWRHHFAPIIALSDPSEALHISIINLQHQFCRHAFVIRGFLSLRTLWPEHYRPGPGNNIRELVSQNAGTWAGNTLRVTESLIIESLGFRRSVPTSATEPQPLLSLLPPLAYAPDHIFHIVLFGPVYFTKAQLVCLSVLNKPVPRSDTTRGLVVRVLDMLREAAVAGARSDSSDEGDHVMTRPPLAKRAVEVLQALVDAWDTRSAEWRAKGAFNGLAPPVREEQNPGHSLVMGSRGRGREAAEKTRGGERDEEDELMSDQDEGAGDGRGPAHNASFRHPAVPRSSLSSHWRASDAVAARPLHHESQAASSSKPDVVNSFNGFTFDLGPFYDSSFILDPSSMLDPSFGFDASFMDVSFS